MKKRLVLVLYIFTYALLVFGGIVSSTIRFHANLISDKLSNVDETVLVYESPKWELYYNKLLVSDNLIEKETEPDALIELPHSWFNLKTKDGNSLPLYGFATYKTTMKVYERDKISLEKVSSNVSFSVYIGNEKVANVGRVSKSFSDGPMGFNYDVLETYVVDKDKTVDVFVEVGYNILGGIDFTPTFANNMHKDLEKDFVTHFYYVILFIYLALYVIEAVSYLKISDSTIYTVNMSGSILLMTLFSPLMNNLLLRFGVFVPPFIFGILNFLFFGLFLFSTLQFYEYTYLTKLKMKGISLGMLFASISTIAYILLIPLRLEIIAFAMNTIGYFILSLKISYFSKLKNKFDITAFLTKCIFYSIIGMEFAIVGTTIDGFEVPVISTMIIYLTIIVLLFALIYVAFIVRTYRSAMKELKTEIQNKDLKLLVLKDQIKPHFVFNCLSAIKTLYHEDEEKGDRAVSLLADHLRYNVDAVSSNLIEFDKEIDNAYNYVELKNLRTENKFNVIFDIDFYEFKVPILSIQPFVENAIKYSRVNEKEGGKIEIVTRCDKDNIYVEINDNGVGFDQNKVKDNSQGIKNARERYSLLLDATIDIASKINEGTKVKITMPKERNNV